MAERDYGREAHEAAERHLEDCFVALGVEEDGGEPIWPEDLESAFDGCTTCVIREVLYAAWPILLQGAREVIAEEIEHVRDSEFHMEACSLTGAAALVRDGWGQQ